MSETTHNNMHSMKVLYIPDYILPQHIPTVYNYFDYYNIAKLKNVQVFDHPEPEYNCEDRPYYCYAIIEVDEWYNTSISRSFYQSIVENNCKMVYDDPYYWDLEFYENEDLNKFDSPAENENVLINIQELNIPSPPSVSLNDKADEYNEDSEKYQVDSYSEDLFESDEEKDDPNDETYEFSDSENEDDYAFEYYIKYDKKRLSKSKKYNSKKRKYNVEVEELKKENNELKELLIKRNKNYLKNNKKKPEKNVWSRRLRTKTTF